jgi:competence protein ComEC
MERTIGHRAPVLWLLLPTMGGFALARALPAGWGGGWWLTMAVAGAALAVFGAWRDGWAMRCCWGAGMVGAVFAAAAAYFQFRESRLAVWERLPPREAELVLEVERVFPSSVRRVTTTGMARIVAAPPLLAETLGQRIYFSVRVPAGKEMLTSARVRVLGVLNPLARRPAAGFDNYLANSGAAFKFNRARWLAEVRPPSAYWQFCARAAHRFERILGAGLDDRPAWRSIHVAMLLGSTAELTEEQRELFMHSGTMHLFRYVEITLMSLFASMSAVSIGNRICAWPAAG